MDGEGYGKAIGFGFKVMLIGSLVTGMVVGLVACGIIWLILK
jgi:hypothetical protein